MEAEPYITLINEQNVHSNVAPSEIIPYNNKNEKNGNNNNVEEKREIAYDASEGRPDGINFRWERVSRVNEMNKWERAKNENVN